MERRSQRIQTRKSSSSTSVNHTNGNGNGNEFQPEKKLVKRTKREDLLKKRREYNFLLEDLSYKKQQRQQQKDSVGDFVKLKKCFSNHSTVIPSSSSFTTTTTTTTIEGFKKRIFCNEFVDYHKEKEDEFFTMESYQNELRESIGELKQLQKELELQKVAVAEKEKMEEEVQLQRELLQVLFSKDSLLLKRIYSKWLLQDEHEQQEEEKSMSDVLLKLQCSKEKMVV